QPVAGEAEALRDGAAEVPGDGAAEAAGDGVAEHAAADHAAADDAVDAESAESAESAASASAESAESAESDDEEEGVPLLARATDGRSEGQPASVAGAIHPLNALDLEDVERTELGGIPVPAGFDPQAAAGDPTDQA